MSWLTPATGLILALAVIPPLVLLYFLKLRRKPQAIASTLLWQRSVEDLRANAPFQRLRKSLLLFLQLLALALLAAAVMQPQIQGGRHSGGRTVIMIDNSASMTATDIDGTSRLDEAKRLARERVEQMYGSGILQGSAGETMIIAFSDRAEIYCQFTDVKGALMRAIDRIEPTDGNTKIAEALKLGRAHTTNVVDAMGEARPIGDPATVELYTDGRIHDLAEQVTRGETINFHPIGSVEPNNVAITSISVERPFDAPTKVQVFVALLNYNLEKVSCRLELSVNGDVLLGGLQDIEITSAKIDEASGVLVPGRNNIVFQPFEQPRDAIIVVRNLRVDDLAQDNIAQLVVPPAKRLRVALVNRQSFVIDTALQGLPLETLAKLSTAQFQSLIERNQLDQYDVYVFDGGVPETLPPARFLIFGSPPPIEGLNPYGDPGGRQFILDARDDHPALRFVATDNLYISRYHRLQPADEIVVLARGSETPVIIEAAKPPMRAIYVAFDPLDSNWPLERSFVTFIFNSIDYLGSAGEAIASEGLFPGDAITTRLPNSARDIELRSPDATSRRLDVGDPSMFSWGPVRKTGVYTVSWAGGGDRREERSFAVNLLSDREGDIGMIDTLEMSTEEVSASRGEGTRYVPLWPYALGLCLVVILFEWWVYNRKMYL